MIKGNTKRFLANIYAEFDHYYGTTQEEAEGVMRDILNASDRRGASHIYACDVRAFIMGGGFWCYTSQACDFLARVYENTDEEKAKFSAQDYNQIWERFVNVCCVYLPKWLKARGVNA